MEGRDGPPFAVEKCRKGGQSKRACRDKSYHSTSHLCDESSMRVYCALSRRRIMLRMRRPCRRSGRGGKRPTTAALQPRKPAERDYRRDGEQERAWTFRRNLDTFDGVARPQLLERCFRPRPHRGDTRLVTRRQDHPSRSKAFGRSSLLAEIEADQLGDIIAAHILGGDTYAQRTAAFGLIDHGRHLGCRQRPVRRDEAVHPEVWPEQREADQEQEDRLPPAVAGKKEALQCRHQRPHGRAS